MPDVRDGTGLLRPSHMMTAVRLTPFLFLLLFLTTCAVSCNGGSHNGSAPPRFVHFVPNSHAFWSDPGNWADETVPNQSGTETNITLTFGAVIGSHALIDDISNLSVDSITFSSSSRSRSW